MIGIGAGDPDHLTLQAVRALRRADVVFVIDKGLDGGGSQDDLLALRTELLRRHRPDGGYRLVTTPEVGRDRGTEVDPEHPDCLMVADLLQRAVPPERWEVSRSPLAG